MSLRFSQLLCGWIHPNWGDNVTARDTEKRRELPSVICLFHTGKEALPWNLISPALDPRGRKGGAEI
jgi:hypothetical protein